MKKGQSQIIETSSGRAMLTKTEDAQPLGVYVNTPIDAQKAVAELRLLQVSPLIVAAKAPLQGKGIAEISSGRYRLTAAAWEKLKLSHEWVTDF